MAITSLGVVFLFFVSTCFATHAITNWNQSSDGILSQSRLSSGCIVKLDHNSTESIYIFGGAAHNLLFTDAIFKWNMNSNDDAQFTQLSTKIPSNITCHQSIIYNPRNNLIYIIGISSHPSNYGIIYTFNPSTDTFESSNTASMPTLIHSNCAAMDDSNNLLYVIGGFNANETVTNELQILNIQTNKWKKQIYIQSIPVYMASSSCWLSLDHRKLYSFGGQTHGLQILSDIYRYNTITNAWHFIANLSKPKTGTKALYIRNYNKVFIIGGYTADDGYIGDIEWFDPLSETVTMTVGVNEYNINGYLMPVYMHSTSEIYIWGLSLDSNVNKSMAVKSNPITYSPTNSPIIPSLSPTMEIHIRIPNIDTDTDIGSEYVNNESTESLLDRNTTIIIAIVSFVLILCSVMAMIYVRCKSRKNKNINIDKSGQKRSRLQTAESDPSEEALNNLCVDDLMKISQKLQNIHLQSPNSADLAVEDDINIVNVNVNENESVCVSENDTICARIGSNTVKSQIGSILMECNEDQQMAQMKVKRCPVRTNNMNNDDLAEGFEHFDSDSLYAEEDRLFDNFKIQSHVGSHESAGVSVMSVSEVQLEGRSIMRQKKRNKRHPRLKYNPQNINRF